ncbi:hypothetical protein OG21DRAFT_1497385 [Imleria badia]|nr:hypothetical protein OG21DRAFT_1497385 [Imleria badia]
MESLCVLPSEVICHILCFLSPRVVILLRLVSKQFNNLTYDLAIWRTLYANARLPRPPGSFPSQSVHFLEHTLVESERLAHSWTTQPMEDISSVGIPYTAGGSFYPKILPKIVYGRWLICCESFSKFVAYDLDSDVMPRPHQLLWESASPIYSWDAHSVVSTSGFLIHILFRIATTQILIPWTLLEFLVNGDSLYHTLALEVPARDSRIDVYLDGGSSPFSYIFGQQLIFDAETRSFYEFPKCNPALVGSDQHRLPDWSRYRRPWVTLFTKTHVIHIFQHADSSVSPTMSSIIIQAFTVPTDPRLVDNGIGVLRLSHEGVAPGRPDRLKIIRNSIVDAVSGATSIRLLNQFFEGNNLCISCIDLTLPNHSSTNTVLPINIDVHDIAHVNHGCFGLLMRYTGRLREPAF